MSIPTRHKIQKVNTIVTANVGVEALQLLDVPFVYSAISSKSINMVGYGWRDPVTVEEISIS